MARKYTYICDGCGHEVTTDRAAPPGYWTEVNITLDGFTNWRSGGGPTMTFYGLLCGQCQLRAADLADPAKWEKPGEVA